jgi:hypothetical protein
MLSPLLLIGLLDIHRVRLQTIKSSLGCRSSRMCLNAAYPEVSRGKGSEVVIPLQLYVTNIFAPCQQKSFIFSRQQKQHVYTCHSIGLPNINNLGSFSLLRGQVLNLLFLWTTSSGAGSQSNDLLSSLATLLSWNSVAYE